MGVGLVQRRVAALDAGDTKYYCFVSLADASPITGSVAGTGAEITQ